jgi:tRNA (mo5U34)-methyltransferase
VSGLVRRFPRTTSASKLNENLSKKHFRTASEFLEKTRAMGHGDLSKYYWYHTIDLPGGLTTPGTYDYRNSLDSFRFPADMTGMEVLDVGSATGFFAFEFERRGAQVTSVEIPSLRDWDFFPGESPDDTLKKIARDLSFNSVYHAEQLNQLTSPKSRETFYDCLLDGPFRFCHKLLNSRVKRCYSTVYNLSKDNLGSGGFDLVFLGDIILHTLYPLKALAAIAPLCRGTLVMAQESKGTDSRPMMYYIGGEKRGEDAAAWWLPNGACLSQMLKKLGFQSVVEVGRNRGIAMPGGQRFDRSVIHATK